MCRSLKSFIGTANKFRGCKLKFCIKHFQKCALFGLVSYGRFVTHSSVRCFCISLQSYVMYIRPLLTMLACPLLDLDNIIFTKRWQLFGSKKLLINFSFDSLKLTTVCQRAATESRSLVGVQSHKIYREQNKSETFDALEILFDRSTRVSFKLQ